MLNIISQTSSDIITQKFGKDEDTRHGKLCVCGKSDQQDPDHMTNECENVQMH